MKLVADLSTRRLSLVEYSTALLLIGLAITIGLSGRSISAQIYVLSLAWAGLTGLLAPRPKSMRKNLPELVAARKNQDGQRIVDHDMASALLTIEGAIMALRHTEGAPTLPAEEQALRVDAIAHAIEGEIGRIRRITTANPAAETECDVVATIDPLVALHVARGATIDVVMEPKARVAIAADDLARAVLNVLDNCCRYAPSAPVTISGFVLGANYCLTVADEGSGMDPAVVERAFERGVSSRRDGGLGLYSVRELIEAGDGNVSLTSSVHGTTVCFELPLERRKKPTPPVPRRTATPHFVPTRISQEVAA